MIKYTAHCLEGEYSIIHDRIIDVDAKLKYLPYAQAGVIYRKNSIILMSYATVAADITNGWLTVSCLCSSSTRRHVSAFLREFAPCLSYYDAKNCYTAGMQINIDTGELRTSQAA